MPPKNDNQHHQAQRRERKDILQEDLIAALQNLNPADLPNIKDERILSILQEALNADADPNLKVNGSPILSYFASQVMLKCFEECFSRGADPTIKDSARNDTLQCTMNSPYMTPSIASRMTRLLLNHAKANKTDFRESELSLMDALSLALAKGFTDAANLFLQKWPIYAHIIMQAASSHRNEAVMCLALEYIADDVNTFVGSQGSYLHTAVQLGFDKVCKLLLDNGANLESNNDRSETPFLVAVRCGSVECMKLLVDHGCDVNAQNPDGEGARELAVYNNQPESLKFLKERQDWENGTRHFELAAAMNLNNINLLKILLKDEDVPLYLLSQIVNKNWCEMLSFVLFEHGDVPGLSVECLEELMKETTNEDIINLLKTKIEMMTANAVEEK